MTQVNIKYFEFFCKSLEFCGNTGDIGSNLAFDASWTQGQKEILPNNLFFCNYLGFDE